MTGQPHTYILRSTSTTDSALSFIGAITQLALLLDRSARLVAGGRGASSRSCWFRIQAERLKLVVVLTFRFLVFFNSSSVGYQTGSTSMLGALITFSPSHVNFKRFMAFSRFSSCFSSNGLSLIPIKFMFCVPRVLDEF